MTGHSAFRDWWRSRTIREQRLLLVGGALAVLTLAWLLVLRPLADMHSDARERHNRAVLALAEARGQAAAIRAAGEAAPAGLTGPLDAMLAQAASEAGFTVSRLDRQGDRQASLAMESVRPQAFFGWLRQLEQGSGLAVDRMTATPNSDRTLAVQVTFKTGGG